MNNTFFSRPTLTGFAEAKHHKKKPGFLGFVAPIDSQTFTDQSTYKESIYVGTPYTDPTYEIDFSQLSCEKLQQLVNDLTAYLQMARLTSDASAYYYKKLDEIKAALAKCKPVESPPPNPTPDPTPIYIPILTPIKDALIATASPGTSSSSGGGFAGGGAAGGGGGDETPAAKKKFNWWMIVAAVLLGYSAYKTNKTA